MLLFLNVEIIAQINRNYETNPDIKRTNIWFFGKEAGINFNQYNPDTISNGKINTLEGCSSFSDTSGNLIIYTDGITIWDQNHTPVETGLMGNTSSSQSALIIKHPEIDSLLYIITTPYSYDYNTGIRYNVYNTQLNRLTKKNIALGNNSAERVAAVYHRNGNDIWVVWHNYGDNCFNTILLTKEGFSTCSIESCLGISYYNISTGLFVNQGQIKFNDNGNRLVQTILNSTDGFELMNFDNLNGKVFGPTKFESSFFPTAAEFAPNSDYLVISSRDSSLIAFDINTGTTKVLYPIHSKNNRIPYIQRNKNNDIICAVRDSGKVGIIRKNNFNTISYDNNYLNLGNGKCYSGLPNFNQSYFYTPSIDFAYKYDCSNNQIKFEGRDTFYSTAQNWQIGKKGKPIEGNYFSKDIKHTFSDTGIYVVQYIAINGTRSDTIKKEIKIYPKINKYFLGKDTFYGQGTSINKTLVAPFGMQCYLWYKDSSKGNTFNADTAGVYVARITNQAFCVVTDTITITECINDLLIPSIYRNRDTLYTFHQLADSFVWFKNNQLLQVTKQPFIKLSDTGTYRVEAARKLHCNRSSSNFHISNLNVNINLAFDLGVKIYPNPADESITFEMQGTNGIKIRLYDAKGNLIYERYSKDLKTQMDISSLAQGLYVIELINEQTLYHSKILIQ